MQISARFRLDFRLDWLDFKNKYIVRKRVGINGIISAMMADMGWVRLACWCYWVVDIVAILTLYVVWHATEGVVGPARPTQPARAKPAPPPSGGFRSAALVVVGLLRDAGLYGKTKLPSSGGSTGVDGSTDGSAGSQAQAELLEAVKTRLNVPKGWFVHFYVVGTLVNTAALLAALRHGGGGGGSGFMAVAPHQSTVCLVLYELQVIRRLLECVFVSRTSPSARMHVSSNTVAPLRP